MSKHTPGPWEIQKDSGLHIYITQPSDKPNRVPSYYAEVRRFTTDQSQVEANARLIAAAPDLLEACESFVEWSEAELNGNGTTFWDRVEMSNNVDLLMKAAIAKARGE